MKSLILILSALVLCSCGSTSSTTSACSGNSWTQTSAADAKSLNDSSGSGSTNYDRLAQTFRISSAAATVNLSSAALILSRTGSFTASTYTATVEIQADAAGNSETQPSGTALASASIDPATQIAGNTEQTVTFTFTAPVTLTTATTYWLIFRADYPVSATNFLKWSAYSGQSNYRSGQGYYRLSNIGTSFLNTNFGAALDFAFTLRGC